MTNATIEALVQLLVEVGHDELTVRDQLAQAADASELASEVAALAVESDVGTLLSTSAELLDVLFELVELLRQSGVAVQLRRGHDATPLLVFGDALVRVYEVRFSEQADLAGLLRALSRVVPDSQPILSAPHYEASDALGVVIMEASLLARLRAALGERIDTELVRDSSDSVGIELLESVPSAIPDRDFAACYGAHAPERASNGEIAALLASVRDYDPRIAWPEGHKRPPGDDFFELANALAAGPLHHCLDVGDPGALANLLYRFALLTTVGAHWDVLAARQNPGMSAQGVLGFGQLSWSWFIFDALGAADEAAASGQLLDTDWVRAQERGSVSQRQRAWFDLGAYLRGGARGPALGRLRELLPLCETDAWRNSHDLNAALGVHCEPHGDQLTHHPLYYAWPAPLYALARRAGALAFLPADNPFLAHRLHMEDVDKSEGLVMRLHQQLAQLRAMDESQLPPLLDPLPVIVDVRITEVDAEEAHGRTMLAAREDAEHHVVAPHAGHSLRPGEVWLFEVRGGRPARARARHDDLGEVSYNIALPTGVWLSRA